MLKIRELRSGYGQSEVLHQVSMQAERAEIVALMGRNGMGKTTLFKTLMGILPAMDGGIEVDGKEIGALPTHQRVKSGVAYVPQGRMMFSTLTVEENIKTGLPKQAGGKVPEEIYAMFPVLFEMRRRKAGNLSGGQQQQLAISRALVTEPKVLLLDEPTEGIQPSIIKDIAKSLREIRKLKNITILVSEQVLSFALDVADRLLVIDRGRIVHEVNATDADVAGVSRYLSV